MEVFKEAMEAVTTASQAVMACGVLWQMSRHGRARRLFGLLFQTAKSPT